MNLKTVVSKIFTDEKATAEQLLARVKSAVETTVEPLMVHPIIAGGIAIVAFGVGFLLGSV